MITKRTVFVLGAGASAPFKFPTGATLCENVIRNLTDSNVKEYFRDITSFDGGDQDSFGSALRYSGKNSVDAFLEHRPEFVSIGKAAIAFELRKYEVQSTLFRNDDNWLRYLFERMNAPLEDFSSNAVSFITFNYDRSLEHFFHLALCNSFGGPEEKCIDALNSLPIVHLHGRLGALPWQDGASRPYSKAIDPDTLNVCTEGIRIVHENIDVGNDPMFQEAFRLLSGAKRVYFLGFGFGEDNVRRLNVMSLREDSAAASGFGLTESELNQIQARCNQRVKIHGGFECLGFLRNRVEWT